MLGYDMAGLICCICLSSLFVSYIHMAKSYASKGMNLLKEA